MGRGTIAYSTTLSTRMMKYFFCFCLLFFTASTNAASDDLYHFNNSHDALRFHELTTRIRCASCQYQTLADSDAPLAADIKLKMAALLADNQTDSAIQQYLTDRYGEAILLNPPFNSHTLWLWIFPFIGITFVITLIFI
jgi:cytochrome c-type biogenesis protein CcmH